MSYLISNAFVGLQRLKQIMNIRQEGLIRCRGLSPLTLPFPTPWKPPWPLPPSWLLRSFPPTGHPTFVCLSADVFPSFPPQENCVGPSLWPGPVAWWPASQGLVGGLLSPESPPHRLPSILAMPSLLPRNGQLSFPPPSGFTYIWGCLTPPGMG